MRLRYLGSKGVGPTIPYPPFPFRVKETTSFSETDYSLYPMRVDFPQAWLWWERIRVIDVQVAIDDGSGIIISRTLTNNRHNAAAAGPSPAFNEKDLIWPGVKDADPVPDAGHRGAWLYRASLSETNWNGNPDSTLDIETWIQMFFYGDAPALFAPPPTADFRDYYHTNGGDHIPSFAMAASLIATTPGAEVTYNYTTYPIFGEGARPNLTSLTSGFDGQSFTAKVSSGDSSQTISSAAFFAEINEDGYNPFGFNSDIVNPVYETDGDRILPTFQLPM